MREYQISREVRTTTDEPGGTPSSWPALFARFASLPFHQIPPNHPEQCKEFGVKCGAHPGYVEVAPRAVA